jgi:hypothetical protein
MELTTTIKKRFIKDYKLPFNIVSEPYFSYYIDLYDNAYDTKTKLKTLLKYLESVKDEDDFFSRNNRLKNDVQSHIKNHPDFHLFKNYPIDKNIISNETFNLYRLENSGKQFISVDIKTANFQTFKFISKKIVNNKKNFVEFIKGFTQEPYIYNSKVIRQVIFGDTTLNPKKQQSIQKMLIKQIINKLESSSIINKNIKISITSDEVIFNKDDVQINFNKEIKKISNELGIELRIEEFSLHKIHKDYDFFIKKHKNDSWDIKKTPISHMTEVYKYILSGFNSEKYKKDLNQFDRVFFHEKRKCQFNDFLF